MQQQALVEERGVVGRAREPVRLAVEQGVYPYARVAVSVQELLPFVGCHVVEAAQDVAAYPFGMGQSGFHGLVVQVKLIGGMRYVGFKCYLVERAEMFHLALAAAQMGVRVVVVFFFDVVFRHRVVGQPGCVLQLVHLGYEFHVVQALLPVVFHVGVPLEQCLYEVDVCRHQAVFVRGGIGGESVDQIGHDRHELLVCCAYDVVGVVDVFLELSGCLVCHFVGVHVVVQPNFRFDDHVHGGC